ncbi:MAG TPA: galactokinase [Longimicrobiales bacterium]|nr:galactokinase [Longimicrobiales bacterium]
MSGSARVEAEFRRRFGGAPAFRVRSPGRVNLIGEHTDYNDGFVLPIAIDREVRIALRPRADERVVVHSLDYDAALDFAVTSIHRDGGSWMEYVKGVAWALRDAGHRLAGWEGVMAGDVPRGAGLSSSAAVEIATLRAFAAAAGIPWRPAEMARLAQRVENAWIGVASGIMDPLVAARGRNGHALLIDCRSLDIVAAPLPGAAAVVVLDTGTRRGLVDSAYNERRRQCQLAAEHFGVPALRDLDAPALESRSGGLDPTALARARHVVTENERTLRAADALHRGDVAALGRLMSESHSSLRHDFEVTNDALDAIVEIAQDRPGCFGARMTGAGFGGCAVALVAVARAEPFVEEVRARYAAATGLAARGYVCRAADGASVEALAGGTGGDAAAGGL